MPPRIPPHRSLLAPISGPTPGRLAISPGNCVPAKLARLACSFTSPCSSYPRTLPPPRAISAIVQPSPVQPSPLHRPPRGQSPAGRSLIARALSSSSGNPVNTGSDDAGSTSAGFDSKKFAILLSGGPRTTSSVQTKRGGPRKSRAGVLTIRNSWNNAKVAISDMDYKLKGWVSAGTCGFKKSKRSSAFAQERVIEEAFKKARAFGMRQVMINMKGPAIALRKPLFKQIREVTGIRVMKLRHSDHVPHGGCKPRKSRRRRYRTKARRA